MKKTVREMFEDIKELEVSDYPPLTIAEVVPFKCNKVEKSLKALEIIKEKRIDIESFYSSFIERDFNYDFYASFYGSYGRDKLTKEEFNLLKEVLKCQKE